MYLNVNGKMGKKKEKEFKNLILSVLVSLEIFMNVNGKTTKKMEMEFWFSEMETYSPELGSLKDCKE